VGPGDSNGGRADYNIDLRKVGTAISRTEIVDRMTTHQLRLIGLLAVEDQG
jgi:hypothetical protein